LIEIDGRDMRQQPIEERKHVLKWLITKSHPGTTYNRHFDVEGAIVFHHACELGCEGIVSKRLGSPFWPVPRLGKGQKSSVAANHLNGPSYLLLRRQVAKPAPPLAGL
jgi:hypothetical protein